MSYHLNERMRKNTVETNRSISNHFEIFHVFFWSSKKKWIEVVSSVLWVPCFENFHFFESCLSHLFFPRCFRDFTQNHYPNGRQKSIERKNSTPIHLKNGKKTQFNSKTNQNKSSPLNLNQSDPNSISTTHRLRLNHLKSSRWSILKFLVFPPGHLHPAVEWSMNFYKALGATFASQSLFFELKIRVVAMMSRSLTEPTCCSWQACL